MQEFDRKVWSVSNHNPHQDQVMTHTRQKTMTLAPTPWHDHDMPLATKDDPRWQKVQVRDSAADGLFVYAVKTTGIYCRPSCPSRAARPENVCFFETPKAAEAKGFRACRRCHPQAQGPKQVQAHLIAEACKLLETIDPIPTLDHLAARIGLSPYHLHRVFKSLTGLTPKAYAKAHQMGRLRQRLANTDERITDAIYEAGFSSASRFYEASTPALGMTPSTYRQGGTDVTIRFAVGQSRLGALLVASSDKGICAISLGDDPEDLIQSLELRFPKARLIGADAAYETLIAQVAALVEAPERGLDLPLDLQGTAFQQRVWQALRQVPVGETISYEELAHRIGQPSAQRAVAKACGANPVAIAIPCHRVIRKDGKLSGYRWGIERKAALLKTEAQAALSHKGAGQ